MRISVHDSHFGCEEYHLGNSGRLPNGGADDIVVRGTFVENNAEPGTNCQMLCRTCNLKKSDG